LMVPEYLLYKLTGVKGREYTNATTMGMVNAQTSEYDMEIVSALGLPERLRVVGFLALGNNHDQ